MSFVLWSYSRRQIREVDIFCKTSNFEDGDSTPHSLIAIDKTCNHKILFYHYLQISQIYSSLLLSASTSSVVLNAGSNMKRPALRKWIT